MVTFAVVTRSFVYLQSAFPDPYKLRKKDVKNDLCWLVTRIIEYQRINKPSIVEITLSDLFSEACYSRLLVT